MSTRALGTASGVPGARVPRTPRAAGLPQSGRGEAIFPGRTRTPRAAGTVPHLSPLLFKRTTASNKILLLFARHLYAFCAAEPIPVKSTPFVVEHKVIISTLSALFFYMKENRCQNVKKLHGP